MHKGRLIYVASPYTSPDRVVQEMRNIQVACATGWLMNNHLELSFFSPICHAHPIANYCKLPGNWEFWKQYDEAMLSRCDEIWVLCIDGWQKSTGVTAELAISVELGLPVKYIHPMGDGEYVVNDVLVEPTIPTNKWGRAR